MTQSTHASKSKKLKKRISCTVQGILNEKVIPAQENVKEKVQKVTLPMLQRIKPHYQFVINEAKHHISRIVYVKRQKRPRFRPYNDEDRK